MTILDGFIELINPAVNQLFNATVPISYGSEGNVYLKSSIWKITSSTKLDFVVGTNIRLAANSVPSNSNHVIIDRVVVYNY